MRHRLILSALALLLLPAAALSGTGTWPTGRLTYTFQQGMYPTAAYSGCTDNTIRYKSGLEYKNFGQSDSLLLSTLTAGDSGEALILLKFDFMPTLPANFVCTRARAWIYKIGHNPEAYTPTTVDRIVWVYRSMAPWTEGSGQNVFPGIDGVSASDSATATSTWPAGGSPDGQNMWDWFWNSGTESSPDSATLSTGFWGTDTLQSSTSYAGTAYNVPGQPEAQFYLRTRQTTPTGTIKDKFGWHSFDVTHYVQQCVIGATDNNGWVITNSTSNLVKWAVFASAQYGPFIHRRPKLEIEGYVPGSGTTTARLGIGGVVGARL